MTDAAGRWRDALEAWALPDGLLEGAPEDPYEPPVDLLVQGQQRAAGDPTRRPVEAHLPDGGTLLDVGCGPGVFAAGYLERARVVGVEPAARLASAARESGIEVIEGPWPEVAEQAPIADVVTCLHVWYDVPDLVPFAEALGAHARGVVVAELAAVHPWAHLAPLFDALHGLSVPSGPTAEDALEILMDELGEPIAVERWRRPGAVYPDLDALVARRRRQLCVGPDRDDEIAGLVAGSVTTLADGSLQSPEREVVTLRWPGTA